MDNPQHHQTEHIPSSAVVKGQDNSNNNNNSNNNTATSDNHIDIDGRPAHVPASAYAHITTTTDKDKENHGDRDRKTVSEGKGNAAIVSTTSSASTTANQYQKQQQHHYNQYDNVNEEYEDGNRSEDMDADDNKDNNDNDNDNDDDDDGTTNPTNDDISDDEATEPSSSDEEDSRYRVRGNTFNNNNNNFNIVDKVGAKDISDYHHHHHHRPTKTESMKPGSNLQSILNNDDTNTDASSTPSSPAQRSTASGGSSSGDVLRYGPPPSARRGVDEGPDIDDPQLADWNINTKELRLAFNFIKKNILFESDNGQQLVSTATWNREYAVVEYQTGLYLLRKMRMVRPKDAKCKKRVSVLEPYQNLGEIRDTLEKKFKELFPDEDPNKITDDYKKTTRRRRKSKQNSEAIDAYNSNLIGMHRLAGVPGMHRTVTVPVATPHTPNTAAGLPVAATHNPNDINSHSNGEATTATTTTTTTEGGSHHGHGQGAGAPSTTTTTGQSMYIPAGVESSSESLKRHRGSDASPLDMEEILRPKRRQRIASMHQLDQDIQNPYHTLNGEQSGIGEIVYTAEEVRQLTRFLHDEHRTHLLGKENAGHLITVKELTDAELLSPEDEKLCLQFLLSKTPHQKYLNLLSAIEVYRAGHMDLFKRIINYVLHST